MKKYFAQLRPFERRLVIGIMVVVFVVLNLVYVEPHFSDWSKFSNRSAEADRKLLLYGRNIAQIPTLQAQVKSLEKQGEFVAFEDQGINFTRTVQSQATQSGVIIVSTQPTHMQTNDAFFVEQVENINALATDQQLVDFLYKLGSDASMIRVRDLELQPDFSHQHLNANIRLVASYQKTPPKADRNLITDK